MNGGGGLLTNCYRGSLSKALQTVYPEHHFLIWRFDYSPLHFNSKVNQRAFFDWMSCQLGCKHLHDWNNIPLEDVHKLGAQGLLNIYYSGSLTKALESIYPEHKWMVKVKDT